MNELRRTIALLTGYIESQSMDVPDELTPAAKIYAAACYRANERLAECLRILQIHQRSEALRQVQLEPDLLNLYRDLAFPQHESWLEITQSVGLTTPPKLNSLAARELERAYADEEKVKGHLGQLRLLSLARAPLIQRLDIVRLLHQIEPANIGWQDDVREYETQRYEEIRHEIAQPSCLNHWDRVDALHKELMGRNWLVPCPIDILDSVHSRHRRLLEIQAECVIAPMNQTLQHALQHGDAKTIRRVADDIFAAAESFGLPNDHVLLQYAAITPKWLKEAKEERRDRKDFNSLVDTLRTALKDGIDWWYVQEYYRAVVEFGRPIPPDVLSAFQARAKARKKWSFIGIIAGVCVLLIAGCVGIALMVRR